ncbi:MAG: hypothetical protein ACYSOW_11545, partial [Planctomycetota bacterium]
ASAETYEVVEDGQVYLVEVVEEVVVAAPNKKSADELSDNIADKLEEMNQRLGKLAEKASNDKIKLLNNKQEKHLKRQVDRSKNANKKMKEDRAFKEAGKKDKFREKKNNSPEALLPVDSLDEELYDTDELEDLTAMIEDMNSLMDDTEAELDRRIQIVELKQQAAVMIDNGLDPDEVYTKLENLLKKSPVTDWHYGGYKAAKIAAVAFRTAYESGSCVTKQTSFGWNMSSAWAVCAAIAGGLDIVAEVLEIKLYTDEGNLSEASYNCIVQIGDEHASMMYDIKGINGQVVQIQADANSMGDSLDLVLTQLDETDGKVDELVTTTGRIETRWRRC